MTRAPFGNFDNEPLIHNDARQDPAISRNVVRRPKNRVSKEVKHQTWRVASLRFVSSFIATVVLVNAELGHGSNERIPTPCEIEWDMGGAFRSAELPNEQVQSQRRLAENGDAQAQYFMGVAVALDQAERILWLQKARANGSKGAAAYYSFYFDPRWNGDIVGALSTQNTTETRAPISIELSSV